MNCVHRDLKPENVLLSDMSEDATIKIVDLGAVTRTEPRYARAFSRAHIRTHCCSHARARTHAHPCMYIHTNACANAHTRSYHCARAR
eukprot:2268674-Pleurochrysis_carterae.AAC.2